MFEIRLLSLSRLEIVKNLENLRYDRQGFFNQFFESGKSRHSRQLYKPNTMSLETQEIFKKKAIHIL